jgi:hypothetical protein
MQCFIPRSNGFISKFCGETGLADIVVYPPLFHERGVRLSDKKITNFLVALFYRYKSSG